MHSITIQLVRRSESCGKSNGQNHGKERLHLVDHPTKVTDTLDFYRRKISVLPGIAIGGGRPGRGTAMHPTTAAAT